jgi:hypothetical protein
MRAMSLVGCLTAGLLVACGEGPPPARYDVFTIELVGPSEGERVFPGQTLTFRTRYVGDLVRNLQFKATFTHESSGESASVQWSEPPQDTASIDVTRRWTLRHEFLERSGRIRVQLQASVTATRNGSTPWETNSQSVIVELYPTLNLEVRLPTDQPLPYGTPIEFQVTGTDLWGDVGVTVLNVDTGANVAGLEEVLSFDGTQPSLGGSWTMRARELERVGTHHLRLVARYGDLEVESDPIAFVVTHTIDEVTSLVRYADGRLGFPTLPYPRLSEVTALGVRISGTQLAGHEVTVNGGPAVIASSDQLDLMVLTPRSDDFDNGNGRKTYEFVVRSGGIEKNASVTLQRWGIESCAWRSSDGRPLGGSEYVDRGTPVVMQALLWGFPDTTTSWFFFKSPQAEFTIWEADPGGRPTREEIDLFQNNDDEVDSFDADVRSDQTEARWATVFEDEYDPLDLHLNAAEYYFEVKVEDQVCTSGEILVPSE